MWKVPLFELNYDEKETLAVQNVLKSKWLTMGLKTIALENKFSKFMGNGTKSVAVSSCTAALHLSLLAAGVKSGDEVIIPSLSFISQLNIIKNIGANPILIDCHSIDNWNINVNLIKRNITNKTKAIIILHYAGYPCDLPFEMLDYCKKNKIMIIEDVAHAPGAEINNMLCGSIGDIGCFSFFSNKNISAGEGGMVVTKNAKIEKKIRFLRSHGMTSISFDKQKGRSVNYDVVLPGFNYRIDEIRSALAIEQLKKLKKANQLRKKHFELYKILLSNTGVKLPFNTCMQNIKSAYHIMPILLPKGINRRKLISYLKLKGIQSSIHYPAYWTFSEYKNQINKRTLPICEKISQRQLTLPLYPSLTKKNIISVCNNLMAFINE